VRDVGLRVEHHDGIVRWFDAAGLLGRPTPYAGKVLFTRDDLRIPGTHNLANAMLAAALARAYGVDGEAISAALRAFGGVEHRLEPVRELDGVSYVNDTTATNPAAALAALAALETPIVLIAGGADKQLEFAALGVAIARRVKALVLLEGSATPRLLAAIHNQERGGAMEATGPLPLVLGPYADFAAAVAAAKSQADRGDTVLLSPGCASFGMFRNEFHRGEEFRRVVSELA
jgi:UDP-N-acetylmuramoylalanine--D-glutamate ligase